MRTSLHRVWVLLVGVSLSLGCGGTIGDPTSDDPSRDGLVDPEREGSPSDTFGNLPGVDGSPVEGETPPLFGELPTGMPGGDEDTTAEPSPLPTGAQPTALWVGDYETGTLSQYNTGADWNFEGSPRPTWPALVGSVGDTPLLEGKFAAQFRLASGQKRQELILRPNITYREGDEYFFGFSLFLDPTFNANSWCVLTQWKNDGTGSPPLEFSAENKGFSLGGGFGHPSGSKLTHRTVPGGLIKGRWTDWVVRVKFSSSPTANQVEVWLDGKQVLAPFSLPGGTLYPGLSSYHKMGLYCDPANAGTRTVWHDNWRIGRTFESVDPRYGR